MRVRLADLTSLYQNASSSSEKVAHCRSLVAALTSFSDEALHYATSTVEWLRTQPQGASALLAAHNIVLGILNDRQAWSRMNEWLASAMSDAVVQDALDPTTSVEWVGDQRRQAGILTAYAGGTWCMTMGEGQAGAALQLAEVLLDGIATDEDRVLLLRGKSRYAYFFSTIANAYAYSEECYNLSRKLRNPALIVGSLSNMGAMLESMAQQDKALVLLNQAVSLAKEKGLHPHQQTAAMCNLFGLLTHISRFEEALELGLQILSMCRKHENPLVHILTIVEISEILIKQEAQNRAAELLEEGVTIAMRTGNHALTCIAISARVSALVSLGRLAEGLELANEGIAIASCHGLMQHKADLLCEVAEIYAEQGDIERCRETFVSALELQRPSNDALLISSTLFRIIHSLSVFKDFQAAVPYCNEILDFVNLQMDQAKLVGVYNTLGEAAAERKRWKEAAGMFKKAQQTLREVTSQKIRQATEEALQKINYEQALSVAHNQKQRAMRLETLLEERTSTLNAIALTIARRQELVEVIENTLATDAKTTKSQLVASIQQILNRYQLSESEQQQFSTQLVSAKARFITALARLCPSLSQRELRIATLLTSELQSKEIAFLLSITRMEVDTVRTRLRKKLSIPTQTNLVTWLRNLETKEIHETAETSDLASRIRDLLPGLTRKEEETCLLLIQGLSTRDISKLLGLSDRTVENHRYRIRKKLGVDASVNLSTHVLSLMGS